MDIETDVTSASTALDRSDFVGFEWIFEMHGTLERLLDRIACEERRDSGAILRYPDAVS